MVYLTPEGIRVADTSNWRTRLVLKEKVDRLLFVGHRANVAYYTTNPTGSSDGEPSFIVWSVDLDSGKRRRIAAMPGRIESINANDTLLAGHRELAPPPPAIAAQGKRDPKTGSPSYSGTDDQGRPSPSPPPRKNGWRPGSPPACRWKSSRSTSPPASSAASPRRRTGSTMSNSRRPIPIC
ncbi:hypothetical protein ACFSUK_28400 [Sphingobium scionense]